MVKTAFQTLVESRYKRKVMKFPEGAIVHDGDCDIFSSFVCTCGLLHLLRVHPEEATQIYPSFKEEYYRRHCNALELCNSKRDFLKAEATKKVLLHLWCMSTGETIWKDAGIVKDTELVSLEPSVSDDTGTRYCWVNEGMNPNEFPKWFIAALEEKPKGRHG